MEKTLENKIILKNKIQIESEELAALDRKILQTEEFIEKLDTQTEELVKTIQIKEEKIKSITEKITELENKIKNLSETPETKETAEENIKIKENLSEEQIEENKKAVDSIFTEKEKEEISKTTGDKKYDDKTRETILEEATKEDKKSKIKDKLKNTVKIFKKFFWPLVGAGTITLAGTGFTKDKDGQIYYDYKTAIKPIVNIGLEIVPETQQQQLIRGLYKWNLLDIPEDTVDYISAKKHFEEKFLAKKTKKEHQEYLKEISFFEKIDEVIDYRASNNKITRKLMRFRNQWANENGFEYIAVPNNGNRQGKTLIYNNVEGVGHFLLDSDISMDQKNKISDDTDPSFNHYLYPGSKNYIEISKQNNHYLPVFTRDSIDGNKIVLKYKLPNELTVNDEIMSPLRQFKFSDVDFNTFKQPIGFKRNVKEVTLKKGVKNAYTGDNSTYLLFTSGNPKSYGQFSGSGVVFIFNDTKGNRIVRDFAGSIYDIQKEGESIIKEFNLSSDGLTIGIHDVGAFGARPVADKNGIFSTDQTVGFHYGARTGSSLLIPKQ